MSRAECGRAPEVTAPRARTDWGRVAERRRGNGIIQLSSYSVRASNKMNENKSHYDIACRAESRERLARDEFVGERAGGVGPRALHYRALALDRKWCHREHSVRRSIGAARRCLYMPPLITCIALRLRPDCSLIKCAHSQNSCSASERWVRGAARRSAAAASHRSSGSADAAAAN